MVRIGLLEQKWITIVDLATTFLSILNTIFNMILQMISSRVGWNMEGDRNVKKWGLVKGSLGKVVRLCYEIYIF